MGEKEGGRSMERGVLLYYKFVEISRPEEIAEWFETLPSSASLVGRIRVAFNGVNVTVGGTMEMLSAHMRAVELHSLLGGCDFKLASCPAIADWKISSECGFISLTVRVVKELITFGLEPSVPPPCISMAGKHLTAKEFHGRIEEAFFQSTSSDSLRSASFGDINGANVVILDARNIYETRIGRFEAIPGVGSMIPKIRQYSDFPGWIDRHTEQLRNKSILMCCTGGVRCELASAYLKSKGEGFEAVYQLFGGIQRYMEAYPNGGFFRGKNFVFDNRIAVSSSKDEVIGSCMLCNSSFDDYSLRLRCSHCRMLVLICYSCKDSAAGSGFQELVCELCQSNQNKRALSKQEHLPLVLNEANASGGALNKSTLQSSAAGSGFQELVCELCQSNQNKRALSKQEHLPLVLNEANASGGALNKSTLQSTNECCNNMERGIFSIPRDDLQVYLAKDSRILVCMASKDGPAGLSSKRLKILCLHGFRQNASSLKGRLASFTKKLRHYAEFVFVDAPHEVPFVRKPLEGIGGATINEVDESSEKVFAKRYAWLVTPAMMMARFNQETLEQVQIVDSIDSLSIESHHVNASFSLPVDADPLQESPLPYSNLVFDQTQYTKQTEGWPQSLAHLRGIFDTHGPFDGVLGFSQGAGIAASLCHYRKDLCKDNSIYFKFVILCSGFAPPIKEDFPSFAYDCPSLHIFGGSSGSDRQINPQASLELASMFKEENRVILQHNMGHIVPTQVEYIEKVKAFLSQFH